MIVLTLIILGLVLYFYSMKCLDAPISSATRLGLTICRIVFLLFLLFLLTLPHVVEIMRVTFSPILYIALDDSISMSYPADPPSSTGQMGLSRWDTTIRSLRDDGLIDRWKKKGFDVRYLLLSQSAVTEAGISAPWFSELPRSASPAFSHTDMSAAISRFSESMTPNEPAYLLFFSDGRWNQGRNPIAAAAHLSAATRTVRPRIYSFGIGTVASIRDVIVDSLQLPAVARSGESLQLQAHLLLRGIEPGIPIRVVMQGETHAGDQIIEQEQQVSVSQEDNEITVNFDIPQLQKGQYLFTVHADPVDREWIDSNNRLSRGILIRDAKDKVLLLTSAPDWEFKYLKRVLEDQENLDVQAYFLHTNGLSPLGDRQWVAQNSTGPNRNPSPDRVYKNLAELQDNLSVWPVIILHNPDFDAEHIEFTRALKNYTESGGGLVFLPGFHNTGTILPALRDHIPPPLASMFSPAGRAAIVRKPNEPNSPFQVLSSELPGLDLPPLGDYISVRNNLDTGKTLLEGMAGMNESIPLVTLYRYGLGRIVLLGSNSFWRWNLLSGRDALTPFWLTVLYQGCPRLQTGSGEIRIEGYLFNVFDRVRISYRAADSIGQPTTSVIALSVNGPSRQETLWLAPTGDSPNLFETHFTPDKPGVYQIASLTKDSTAEFRVENTAVELHDLRQDISGLQELARITGGEYANQPAWHTLADKLPVEAKVNREERSRFLGEKWWIVTLLILCLGAEWFLRWMKGLP